MDDDTLVKRLRRFYVLEAYQVDLYKSQLTSLEDPHIQHVFERFMVREQEHMDYLEQQLKEMGTGVGIAGPPFKLAGMVTGKALDLLSLKDRYKLGIAVEQKAIQMYHEFIETARNDPRLSDLSKYLAYFMVDEETHQFWFKEHLSRLEDTRA
ncbi:MAG: ferritin-like domain-containing protein [Candidatus Desulforudis sp.]|nr:ferritin-like domain-containing protein [Desulforudis sp.]